MRRGIALGVEPCELKSVNGARLEAVVWDVVSKFLKDPKVFMAEVKKQRVESGQERGSAESKIKELHRKFQTVKASDCGKQRKQASRIAAGRKGHREHI